MSRNPSQPFINEASQDERYEIVVNDRRVNTYLSHTDPNAELGGRYRKLEPQSITGQTPIPQAYAGAPWTREDAGLEPPLGWSVEAQEPVGTEAEVRASLGDGSTFTTSVADDATAISTVASSEEPAPAPRSPSSAGTSSPPSRGKGDASSGNSLLRLSGVAQPNNNFRRI
jgi:hypothetical protein